VGDELATVEAGLAKIGPVSSLFWIRQVDVSGISTTKPAMVYLGFWVSVTGMGRDAFDVANHLFRRMRGGLGIGTVGANAIFAAITGISIASAAISFLIIAVEIGLLTPPVGIWVFVIKSALDDPAISLGDIFIGAAPFAVMMLVVLALVLAFPVLATGLI